MKQLFFILALAAPALAQEPMRAIVPADPVSSVSSRSSMSNVMAVGDPKAEPLIFPVPLPLLKKPLGTVARELRAIHATDPKAKTVANDETPIDTDDRLGKI